MDMPDQIVLIARGTFTTLSSERKRQLKRHQDAAQTAMHSLNAAMRDAEKMPPDSDAISTVEKCLNNMKAARGELVALCNRMNELRPMAWPE